MLIRRKTADTSEAIQYTGNLNPLITWLGNIPDFDFLVYRKDQTVTVNRADSTNFNLQINDWIRINESSRLDRIRAANFATDWEIVP